MGDRYHLDIDNSIKVLLQLFPEFEKCIVKFYDLKQGNTVKMTIENTSVPRFPLTVTMYEFDGIYVDFGDMTLIEQEKSIDQIVLGAISDVLNDRCIVILAYKNEQAYEKMKSYFGESYFDSLEEEFNDMDEYHLFINKLSMPVKGLRRFFSLYKGIIEVSNWSGNQYMKMYR